MRIGERQPLGGRLDQIGGFHSCLVVVHADVARAEVVGQISRMFGSLPPSRMEGAATAAGSATISAVAWMNSPQTSPRRIVNQL